ncbi:MAG: TatD family hydrolase [Clostridiales bacterium]|nr:TatD family hydrolase [Clostridiales bacterium]
MLFDSHAHLDDKRFDKDRKEIIEGLISRGVGRVLNAGADMKSSLAGIELAKEYSHIYAAVGVHPHDVKTMEDCHLNELENMSKEKKVVAIGEIGLDFYYDNSPRDVQRERFIDQIDLADRVGLPIIVHNRDAHKDTLDILRDNRHKLHGGVMHCYSGSAEMLKDFLDIGFYISLGGPVTFKNARKPVEVAKQVPLDKLLIETDCPYLTPHPFRGKRNDPGYVGLVAEKIAKIRDIPLEKIARVTFENASKLFRIRPIQ